MKLGIIGYGFIVQEFLPGLSRLSGVELRAILGKPGQEHRVNALCQQYRIPHAVYTFSDLAKTGIDTVYVAVPNHLHFRYAKLALEAGLHVIVEKPMVSNLREAEALQALALERSCLLLEAITTLYLPGYGQARRWLERIGQVRLVHSHMGQFSRRYDAFCKGEILPAFDPQKSGGALMDLNVYNIHFVSGLFGVPEEVTYTANVERGIDTSGILTLKYPGFAAVCTASKDCADLRSCSIHGTLGSIWIHTAPSMIGEVILELRDGTKEVFPDPQQEERHLLEFAAFRDAIAAKDLDFSRRQLAHSLQVMGILDAARASAHIPFPADAL